MTSAAPPPPADDPGVTPFGPKGPAPPQVTPDFMARLTNPGARPEPMPVPISDARSPFDQHVFTSGPRWGPAQVFGRR